MSPVLKQVLDEAVRIVNFIKAHPTNACLFGVLCDEMGAATLPHGSLLAVAGQGAQSFV